MFGAARDQLGSYLTLVRPHYDYVPFQQEVLCTVLQELATSPLDKAAVFAPPRMGKSDICTATFPAWYLGHHPSQTVITLCAAGALAKSFGAQTRRHIESPAHAAVFPGCQIAWDSRAKDDFALTAGGHYYALGFDGQLTGHGAHLLIIDDPIKNTQDALSEAAEQFRREVFTSAVNTRLEPGAKLLLVMTKWPSEAFSEWLLDLFGWEDITSSDIARWRRRAR